MTEIVGFHHLSLSVVDLTRSTAWYTDVLGFEVTAEIEGDGFRRTRLRTPGGGITLSLTAHDHPGSAAFDERCPGMDHVAFVLGSEEDVALVERRLAALGVDHSPVKAPGGGPGMITLRDPDNIQIEVFAPRLS
jgi:catechol 2,3-dioxygenase-like lactoylglutathione lyase family enzyme